MLKVSVVNMDNKKEDKVSLDPVVFGADLNESLISQVYYVYRSNARKHAAHAKTRGDVSGGGRKPWKQKGTGRARHGSIRSPLWVGGGVSFVPSGRNWKRKVNKKMVYAAIRSVVSARIVDDSLRFVAINSEVEPKKSRKFIEDLVKSASSVLLIVDKPELIRSLRNLKKVSVKKSRDVNILDLINNSVVLFDVEAVDNFVSRVKKND